MTAMTAAGPTEVVTRAMAVVGMAAEEVAVVAIIATMMMTTIVPSHSQTSLLSTPSTRLPLSPPLSTLFPKLLGQPWDLTTSMRLPWSAASLSSVLLASSPRLSARCSIIARLSRLRLSRSPNRPLLLVTLLSSISSRGCSLLRLLSDERQPLPPGLFGAKGRKNNLNVSGMHRPPMRTLSFGRAVTLSSRETGHPSSQFIDQPAGFSMLLTTIDSRKTSSP